MDEAAVVESEGVVSHVYSEEEEEVEEEEGGSEVEEEIVSLDMYVQWSLWKDPLNKRHFSTKVTPILHYLRVRDTSE